MTTKVKTSLRSIRPEILKLNQEKDKKLIAEMEQYNNNGKVPPKPKLPAIGVEYKEVKDIVPMYKIWTRAKVKTKKFLGWIGLPWGYVTPLYHLVVFFPNNIFTIMPVPQNLDGTFTLKKTTFIVNQEDVKFFNGSSFLFYNHDDVIPLRVASRELDRQDAQRYSSIIKSVMSNKLVLDFLKEERGIDSQVIKYMLIGVLVIVGIILVMLLHYTGVIDLSTLFSSLGGK